MKASCLRAGRVWVACLALAAAGAVLSATLAHACSSSGCSAGCKLAGKWCNGPNVAWDFGVSAVVVTSSCAVSPNGGSPYNFQPRSYDVYAECTRECSSDTITPGTIPPNDRETFSQANFYTFCNSGS